VFFWFFAESLRDGWRRGTPKDEPKCERIASVASNADVDAIAS
jgi:hypothetical protein